ncbi:MAG: N-methyl-L-tryptophan oxidase [Armatimonadetes bacterium]|nr:N-methyl-L-tryptophan oxidase [Armatimonadota bacterium]MDW8121795.1 N-methyl-L-tryptophan oxidase [Armatimonadota bacterium]
MAIRVVVAGLGAMGSAIAYHLTSRGAQVIGMDPFCPPHPFGSSHGKSRIIREAYFEDPAYVPLVQRAYELWQDLESRSQSRLLTITGGLMIGPQDGVLVSGALKSAAEHGLRHQVLDRSELMTRFPFLRIPEGFVGVYEPRAGILDPEGCIRAHLNLARAQGADLRFGSRLLSWTLRNGVVEVATDQGVLSADALVLSLGPWLLDFLADLPLQVERQVMFWFAPSQDQEHLTPDRCPIYIVEYEPQCFFYGFPNTGDGLKVARHHQGEITHPETVRRVVSEEEVEEIRRLVLPFLPAVSGPLKETQVCLYTNTPDGHFLIDRVPGADPIFVVSPCSGHGFKFASVIGEAVARWILDGNPGHDLSLFSWKRWSTP